ncbi:MAG TPA: carboxypeptidase-like regulatory domain-containing protein, partial [Terriglobales bacterium]|nr:carboxypeptidase-like regulatory domain-containing protein [Terriglobales bacterium]
MTSRKLLFSASLLLCLSLTSSSAHAQYRASIQGVISDQQGAIVQDATVNLTNKETNRTTTTTSNAAGVYSFNALPPSQYSMTVEKTGFKKKVLDNIGVIAEQANSVNVQIDIGQTSETVTVQGDATPLIDTETANVSGTVTAHQIQTMPSFGRDVFQLLQLAPGAFGDGAQAS